MEIREIAKPQGVSCPHLKPGVGCATYATRPGECTRFYCGYLTIRNLGEAWKPDRSRIVLAIEEDGKRLSAHVDLTRPDAWRREPYHSQLRQWAAAAVPAGRLVVVRVGQRMFVILPDREVDLGEMSESDRIVTRRRDTPAGPRWDAANAPPPEL